MGSPDVYVGVRRVLSIHSGHLWPYPRESWVEGSRGKTRRLADGKTGRQGDWQTRRLADKETRRLASRVFRSNIVNR